MIKINVKPLSVNEAFNGKRTRSKKYNAFKKEVTLKLRPMKLPEPPYQLNLRFGFSSNGSDVDNCVKSIQDVLQKKYQFNDNQIWRIIAEKTIVPKGEEFIEYKIESYEQGS
jgi:Holliday junction resolvase RusA-like endonuclease